MPKFSNTKWTVIWNIRSYFRSKRTYMGCDARKPVFSVFDKVIFKPACSAAETSYARSKSRYCIFQYANNKGADQTAWMRRLVCGFVVCNSGRPVFSCLGPYISDFIVPVCVRQQSSNFSIAHCFLK